MLLSVRTRERGNSWSSHSRRRRANKADFASDGTPDDPDQTWIAGNDCPDPEVMFLEVEPENFVESYAIGKRFDAEPVPDLAKALMSEILYLVCRG